MLSRGHIVSSGMFKKYISLTVWCPSMQALCLVGCKAVYPNQASVIAQELINGGCIRLAMVEAGNQLPNAAPFPAQPPPPPPLLYPAQGVTYKNSESSSDPSGKVEKVYKCEDSLVSEGADQQTTEKPQDKDVSFSILCISPPNFKFDLSATFGVRTYCRVSWSSSFILHFSLKFIRYSLFDCIISLCVSKSHSCFQEDVISSYIECLQVGHGMRTATEMQPPVGRLEGDTQAEYAAATQQFQQGQMELSGGNMSAATDAFRAACHFNPSAAAYTFMAWMQRLVSVLLFEWSFCSSKRTIIYELEVSERFLILQNICGSALILCSVFRMVRVTIFRLVS